MQPTPPTTDEQTQCPSCERNATHRELAEHRGVCEPCHKTFSRAHRPGLLHHHADRHLNIEPQHHPNHLDEQSEKVRHGVYIESVQPADFIFFDEKCEAALDESTMAGEALWRLLSWLWQPTGRTADYQTAFRRFVAISAALNPGWLDDQSYQTIAAKLGVTRQSISKNVMHFTDHFKMHARRSKREHVRKILSRAQRGHPNYHHK